MNTEPFTTPSPDLQQHTKDLKDHATQGAQDLKQDVGNVAQDVKNQATQGVQAVKDEANARFGDAKQKAGDLYESAKSYAAANPLTTFGFGILVGLFLSRRRK
jgi:ElaB/YqjD/DUF883 family membrane-anchored ribosome-binding protein